MKANDNKNCYLCKKLIIDQYYKKVHLCNQYNFIGSDIEATYFCCEDFVSIIQLIKSKENK